MYLSGQRLESLTQPGFDYIILRCQPKEDSYKYEAEYILKLLSTLSSDIPWNNPQSTCIFLLYIRAFRRVCFKKMQVTSGIFHGIPQESVAQLFYTKS